MGKRSGQRLWLCRGCGYDLRSLPAGNCPECGTLFDPARRETFRPAKRPLPKWFDRAQLIVALYPAWWLLCFYVLMGIAYLEVGRWPRVYQDNPTFYGMDVLLDLLMFSCLLTPLYTLLAVVMGAGLISCGNLKMAYGLFRTLLIFLTWGMLYGFMTIDPGGCFEWLFD